MSLSGNKDLEEENLFDYAYLLEDKQKLKCGGI